MLSCVRVVPCPPSPPAHWPGRRTRKGPVSCHPPHPARNEGREANVKVSPFPPLGMAETGESHRVVLSMYCVCRESKVMDVGKPD
jgi:hypothetical protein